MPRLIVGESIPSMTFESLNHGRVSLPSRHRTHVQFRRFAGCPICNLHLRDYSKGIDRLKSARIDSLVFFHSTFEEMKPYQGHLPFAVVPDPTQQMYRRFGVERSLQGLFHPRAIGAFVKGIFSTTSNAIHGSGGHAGLPADFLIEPGGRIVAVKYGTHADDQWSVDEVLALTVV